MTVTWKATPAHVGRLLDAVFPHVSDDGQVPMLTTVRIEVDGDQFVAVATDRYTMGVCWSALTEWDKGNEPVADPVRVCFYARDLRRLLAFTRQHRTVTATWTFTDTGLRVDVLGESLSIRYVDVEFVGWRPLLEGMPQQHGDTAPPTMAFRGRPLDHILASAKALGGDAPMMWHTPRSPLKPVLVRIGGQFVAVLMPCKYEEQAGQLDLSGLGIGPKAVAA